MIAVDLNHYVLKRDQPKTGKRRVRILESRIFGVGKDMPDVISLMMDSLYIMQRSLSMLRLKEDRPEVIVRPKIGDVGFIEFNRAREIIEVGRTETESMMADIMKAVSVPPVGR